MNQKEKSILSRDFSFLFGKIREIYILYRQRKSDAKRRGYTGNDYSTYLDIGYIPLDVDGAVQDIGNILKRRKSSEIYKYTVNIPNLDGISDVVKRLLPKPPFKIYFKYHPSYIGSLQSIRETLGEEEE